MWYTCFPPYHEPSSDRWVQSHQNFKTLKAWTTTNICQDHENEIDSICLTEIRGYFLKDMKQRAWIEFKTTLNSNYWRLAAPEGLLCAYASWLFFNEHELGITKNNTFQRISYVSLNKFLSTFSIFPFSFSGLTDYIWN